MKILPPSFELWTREYGLNTTNCARLSPGQTIGWRAIAKETPTA